MEWQLRTPGERFEFFHIERNLLEADFTAHAEVLGSGHAIANIIVA